jgi:CRP-like cAMP-binding protein
MADFRRVSTSELTWIDARKLGQWRCEAGAAVVEEGSDHKRLYTLLEGWAFRFRMLPDGRRQILNIILPGDVLGLQAELLAGSPHGVEALTDVSLCAFPRTMALALYREHPELALDLTWLAAHGERLTDEVLLSVGRRSALERVAMLLVHLYKRAASVGLAEGGSIPFPLTQAHVADTLGLSVVHINRVLQRLRRGGLIVLKEGRLGIGDFRSLRRVAAYWDQPAPVRPLL